MIRFATILSIVILLISCDKHETKDLNIDSGIDFYPLQTGNWIMYDVREIYIDLPVSRHDTIKYQLKQVVAEKLDTANNKNLYRITQYRRADSLSFWIDYKSFLAEYDNNNVFVTIDNIKKLELKLPLYLQKEWNSNQYNANIERNYTVNSINDSLLNIKQRNDSTLIFLYSEFSTYKKNVGLIQYKKESIESQSYNEDNPIDMTLPIRNRIVTGEIIEMSIISWGEN